MAAAAKADAVNDPLTRRNRSAEAPDRPAGREPTRREFWLAMACGLGAALIWGGFPAISRLGIQSQLNAFDITAIRYLVAGLVLLPVMLRRGFQGVPVPALLILCCGAGAPYLLLAAGGLSFAPASHFGVIGPSTMLLLTAFGGWLWQNDRFTKTRVFGMLLIVAGIFVMGWDGLRGLLAGDVVPAGRSVFLGDLMFVGAGAAWAAYTLATRHWRVAPLHSIAIVAVLSMLFYTPFYLWRFDTAPLLNAPPGEVALQAVFQGVLSAFVALFLYARAVSLLGSARGAVFAALVPATATLLAIPILDEWPTLLQLSGVGEVSVGMCFALGLVAAK